MNSALSPTSVTNEETAPDSRPRAVLQRAMPMIRLLAGYALLGFVDAAPVHADTPCCAVTNIAQNGIITAKEARGTRTFHFQLTDSALRNRLRVGSPVYANFSNKQVSLDGKNACCTMLKVSIATEQSEPGMDSKNKPSGKTAPSKQTTTTPAPKIDVTASEGASTATAIRGRPATPAGTAKQSASSVAQAGSQTQAVNPEVIALQNASDLVVKDLGFTGLGEVTFKLVNRGKVGINVPLKPGSAKLAAQTPQSGPPIAIDIWIGSNKISVQQASLAGNQTKQFIVPMPSNYSKPRCLETRDLKVVVDPQNRIPELHDDNNVTEAPNSARPCPDLAIKSIKRHHTGTMHETYRVKVTVINQGNAPSPSAQAWGTSLPGGVWPVTGWPELVPIHTIKALAPGESTSFLTGGSVLTHVHTSVRVVLDYYRKIEESDETNNFMDKRL